MWRILADLLWMMHHLMLQNRKLLQQSNISRIIIKLRRRVCRKEKSGMFSECFLWCPYLLLVLCLLQMELETSYVILERSNNLFSFFLVVRMVEIRFLLNCFLDNALHGLTHELIRYWFRLNLLISARSWIQSEHLGTKPSGCWCSCWRQDEYIKEFWEKGNGVYASSKTENGSWRLWTAEHHWSGCFRRGIFLHGIFWLPLLSFTSFL